METTIDKAIALRKQGKPEESRLILSQLLSDQSYAARANLHIAWSYDCEGKETEAVPYYKESLKGHLSIEDKFDALLGLASTLRCLGHFEEALMYFEQLAREFPESEAVKPFHAMCLHNCGHSKRAVEMLLKTLLSTTNSEAIKAYNNALSLYSEDIERTW
ncbi:MAG TPA: hypothetical protein DCG57_15005 [Candidatus Riflebacteria bacterium]|jgi:tetratricopeptide (TPR) repeat protein|nr:hypothetical protein [Candidatus Riflebacteria bacterium]